VQNESPALSLCSASASRSLPPSRSPRPLSPAVCPLSIAFPLSPTRTHRRFHRLISLPAFSRSLPCTPPANRERSFLESKAIIDAHNSHADASFTLGFTPFADYTGDEFVTQRLNYKSRHSLREKRMEKRTEKQARLAAGRDGVTAVGQLGVAINASPDAFPRSFDWADVPEVMGKIHTQETSCASCWAYTSTDTIEAQVVISGRQKTHVELSAEQLINCDGYDSGCNTGNMFTAYEWIHDNGGIATARTFHAAAQVLSAARSAALTAISSAAATTPSEVSDMHSDGEQQTAAAAEVGFAFKKALGSAEEERAALDAIESSLGEASMDCPAELPLQDRVYGYCELDFEAGEAALMEAVAKNPVAIGINANKVFQLYAGGIIRASDCGPAPHTQDAEIMSINHAVIVTGWGESRVNGELMKFWVLKNSFGEGWGERGYFKLERGGHSLDEEASARVACTSSRCTRCWMKTPRRRHASRGVPSEPSTTRRQRYSGRGGRHSSSRRRMGVAVTSRLGAGGPTTTIGP